MVGSVRGFQGYMVPLLTWVFHPMLIFPIITVKHPVILAVTGQLVFLSIVEDLPRGGFKVVPWYSMLLVDFVGFSSDQW